MKTLQGDISIGRVHSNIEKDFIEITLTDKNSHCHVVKVKVSLEAFAKAITGLYGQECSFDFYDSGMVGKYKEYKKEKVLLPNFKYGVDDDTVKAALVKYDIDGWKSSVYDAKNHKNIIKYGDNGEPNVCSIGFTRYMDYPPTKEDK